MNDCSPPIENTMEKRERSGTEMSLLFQNDEIDVLNNEMTIKQNPDANANANAKSKSKTKSKSKKENSPKKKKADINFENYMSNKLEFSQYKIPELKEAAKKYKQQVTGSKPVLINRIETHFIKISNSIKIQKRFRGFIVRFSKWLRGPAYKNLKKCVNDTDFVTMEPLDEIPFTNIFSYEDAEHFIYGFNVTSLIQMYKKKQELMNPYNRKKMPANILSKIISLYKISYIIYPDFKNENEPIQVQTVNAPQESQPSLTNIAQEENAIMNRIYRPRLVSNYTRNQDNYNRYNRIVETRNKPVSQRITELFIEIDHLGNYTQSSWFSNLEIRQYYQLYRTFYDIWTFRSQMNLETKMNICPFHGPFDGIFTRTPRVGELDLDEIRLACLIVMENMIYSGVDIEYCKIGCLHALSALTIVSREARQSMFWLYESVML